MTRRAYRTLVRLETAAHRAKHKGLCEMCFTVLAAHECFASHDTWKLDVKPAMWKIRRAMQQRERIAEGEEADDQSSESSGEAWQRMGQVSGMLQHGEDGLRDQPPHRRGELQARMPARAPELGRIQRRWMHLRLREELLALEGRPKPLPPKIVVGSTVWWKRLSATCLRMVWQMPMLLPHLWKCLL